MTICQHSKASCYCQPSEGIVCPHAPVTRTYDPALWQLVPKQITDEMLRELGDSSDKYWIRALAAAPSAPEQLYTAALWNAFREVPNIPDGLYAQVKNFLASADQPKQEGLTDDAVEAISTFLQNNLDVLDARATSIAQGILTLRSVRALLASQPSKQHDANCWQNFKHADDTSSHCDCSLASQPASQRPQDDEPTHPNHPGHHDGLTCEEVAQRYVDLVQENERLQGLIPASQPAPSPQEQAMADALETTVDVYREFKEWRKTSQPVRTALEQYDLEQSPEYRKGYEAGRLKGFDVGHRYGMEQASQSAIPALRNRTNIERIEGGVAVCFGEHEKDDNCDWEYFYTSQPAATMDRTAFINRIVLAVAEIPDRDSPEDQPEMMLVNGDELRGIITSSFEIADESNQQQAAPSEPDGWLYGNSFWERGNPRITDDVRKLGKPMCFQQPAAPVAAVNQPINALDADDPSELEQVIACLGDDAAKLNDDDPEIAENMRLAAKLLETMDAEFQVTSLKLHDAELALGFKIGTDGPAQATPVEAATPPMEWTKDDVADLHAVLAEYMPEPRTTPSTLGQQVAKAQAEMATWPDSVRASVCGSCNGAGVIGTPGMPCPFCKLQKDLAAIDATPAPVAVVGQDWQYGCGPACQCAPHYQHEDCNEDLTKLLWKAPAQAVPSESVNTPAINGTSIEAYPIEDQAFFKFWYGHMVNDQITGALVDVGHSTARYIWNAALKTGGENV